MHKALSIVVPCYNEEKNIPLILERFRSVIDNSVEKNIELVLVNNGSTDQSHLVFENELKKPHYHFVHLVHVPVNQGYGFGILSGLKHAYGDVLAWTHADMQTDPEDVIRAYHMLQSSRDPQKTVIKGKRIKRPLPDTLFTLGMSVIASSVLGKILFDINAQPKLFPRSFYDEMKSPPHDFSLDLYWLYLAKKLGYQVKTLDVLFKKRIHGESKWAFSFSSKMKTILRTIRYIFTLRSRLHNKNP